MVSLLVAVRNEATALADLLVSIEAQDYPGGLVEVVIADGRSTDESARVGNEFCARHPTWQLVDNPDQIQAAAWNLGIAVSHGALLAIVSAHAQLAPSWVTNAVDTIQRTGADMVGGRFTPIGEGVVGQAVAAALSSWFGTGGALFRLANTERDVDTVFMGVCKAETYRRYPFDARLVRNQDDEHSYRIRDGGGRIVMNPQIQSTYRTRNTLPSLAVQYFQYGFWKVRVLAMHPRQVRPRHLVPALFMATLMTLAVSSFLSSWAWVGLAALVIAYVVAAAVASLQMHQQVPDNAMALLPLVFATLHASYGVGMIVGALAHVIPRSHTQRRAE